jgi:hypothetical protein
MAETVFDAHVLRTSREICTRGNGGRSIVGMAQFVDMQRFDFVLGPAEQVCPCGIDAEEIAVEVRNAEQILRDFLDAIAFAGALPDL